MNELHFLVIVNFNSKLHTGNFVESLLIPYTTFNIDFFLRNRAASGSPAEKEGRLRRPQSETLTAADCAVRFTNHNTQALFLPWEPIQVP